MPSEREIDERVAREVFGCKTESYKHVQRGTEYACGYEHSWHGQDHIKANLRRYSSRIEDAWLILDKFGFVVGPEYRGGVGPCPRIGWAVYGDWATAADDVWDEPGSARALAVAETLPMAICLAALKSVTPTPKAGGNG